MRGAADDGVLALSRRSAEVWQNGHTSKPADGARQSDLPACMAEALDLCADNGRPATRM